MDKKAKKGLEPDGPGKRPKPAPECDDWGDLIDDEDDLGLPEDTAARFERCSDDPGEVDF